MDTTQVIATFAAAFTALVGTLVWFIKRVFERDERNTDKFITTLENVVVRNAATMEAVGHAVTELTTLVREARVADREDQGGEAGEGRAAEMRRMGWRLRFLPLCRDPEGIWFWKYPYGWLEPFRPRDWRGTMRGASNWIRMGVLSGWF